jgi:hypothetical protein
MLYVVVTLESCQGHKGAPSRKGTFYGDEADTDMKAVYLRLLLLLADTRTHTHTHTQSVNR